jgi:pyruvate dehydrogenase E2 component (dihydrolipoamide acetyltransferase)
VPEDVKLPELAESVVEGEVLTWLLAVGDAVAVDQPLVEVMTDKVTVELPSPVAGVLIEIVAAEGAVVPVGAVLARIEVGAGVGERVVPRATDGGVDDEADGVAQGDEFSLFKAAESGDEAALPTIRRRAVGAPVTGAEAPRGANAPAPEAPTALRGAFGRVVAVPAARRLARELGVPIEQVLGSGPAGRVRVDDVRRQAAHVAPATGGLPASVRPVTPKGYEDRERRVPLRGLRRAITNQMVASHLRPCRVIG